MQNGASKTIPMLHSYECEAVEVSFDAHSFTGTPKAKGCSADGSKRSFELASAEMTDALGDKFSCSRSGRNPRPLGRTISIEDKESEQCCAYLV